MTMREPISYAACDVMRVELLRALVLDVRALSGERGQLRRGQSEAQESSRFVVDLDDGVARRVGATEIARLVLDDDVDGNCNKASATELASGEWASNAPSPCRPQARARLAS
jgi:hypothetical protein